MVKHRQQIWRNIVNTYSQTSSTTWSTVAHTAALSVGNAAHRATSHRDLIIIENGGGRNAPLPAHHSTC
jgi:hypothetical protein